MQGGASHISPTYSPSACVQSPSYTNVNNAGSGEKPKISAYSPTYSPSAFTPGSLPHGSGSEHSSGDKLHNSGTIPINSPLYVPPSMGSSSSKHIKSEIDAVVSPKYSAQ